MTKLDLEVVRMVEREIVANPNVGGDILFEKAKRMSPKIGKLSRRQFHALYPLQVKRRHAGSRQRSDNHEVTGTSATGQTKATRAVRQVFLRFAQDVAGAQGKELVEVISRLDRYVEDALEAAGPRQQRRPAKKR